MKNDHRPPAVVRSPHMSHTAQRSGPPATQFGKRPHAGLTQAGVHKRPQPVIKPIPAPPAPLAVKPMSTLGDMLKSAGYATPIPSIVQADNLLPPSRTAAAGYTISHSAPVPDTNVIYSVGYASKTIEHESEESSHNMSMETTLNEETTDDHEIEDESEAEAESESLAETKSVVETAVASLVERLGIPQPEPEPRLSHTDVDFEVVRDNEDAKASKTDAASLPSHVQNATTGVHGHIMALAAELEDMLARTAPEFVLARAEVTSALAESMEMHRIMYALLTDLGFGDMVPRVDYTAMRGELRRILPLGPKSSPRDYMNAIANAVVAFRQAIDGDKRKDARIRELQAQLEAKTSQVNALTNDLRQAVSSAASAKQSMAAALEEKIDHTKHLIIQGEGGEFVLMHGGQKLGWFMTGKRRDSGSIMVKSVKLTRQIEEAMRFASETDARTCLAQIRKRAEMLEPRSGVNPKGLGWYVVGRVSVEYVPPVIKATPRASTTAAPTGPTVVTGNRKPQVGLTRRHHTK